MRRKKRNIDRECVLLLLKTISHIYRDYRLMKICLKHKDYEETLNIIQEDIDWLKELGLIK